MSEEHWRKARKILCVRLDAMGDLLMTGPAIRALKQARPDRKITLLTSPTSLATTSLLPEVDEVIAYSAPWMKPEPKPEPGSAQSDLEMILRLRDEGFDAAAIFTVYSQNPLPAALFCYLAGIPLRLAHCRENPYHLLTDWAKEFEPEQKVRHEVQRQLDLVAEIGALAKSEESRRMRIHIPGQARTRVERLLFEELALSPKRDRLIVLHPGASAASRRYPAERFAEAARSLVREDPACVVLVTGSKEEAQLAEDMRRNELIPTRRILPLAGKLELPELAALIDRAELVITNNSGPAHLAAATGTPVVDLYALTNPQHTPWMVPSRVLFHDVPCRYCYKSVCPEGHHHCLTLVPPSDVVRAARELLSRKETHADLRNQCRLP